MKIVHCSLEDKATVVLYRKIYCLKYLLQEKREKGLKVDRCSWYRMNQWKLEEGLMKIYYLD